MVKLKVVLDTNILISSVLTPKGETAGIWAMWRREEFDLVTSKPLYAELKRKLKEFRKEGAIPKITERRTLNVIRRSAVFVEVTQIPKVVRDPKDDMVIATAVAAKADFLISGDKDILALGKVYKKIKICRPAEFPV